MTNYQIDRHPIYQMAIGLVSRMRLDVDQKPNVGDLLTIGQCHIQGWFQTFFTIKLRKTISFL